MCRGRPVVVVVWAIAAPLPGHRLVVTGGPGGRELDTARPAFTPAGESA
jgi:hypothetical protein